MPHGDHVIAGNETLHQRMQSYADSLWRALAFSDMREGAPPPRADDPHVLRWALLQLLISRMGSRYATAARGMLDRLQDQLNDLHRHLRQLLQAHPAHHAALWGRANALVRDAAARVASGAPGQTAQDAFGDVVRNLGATDVRKAPTPIHFQHIATFEHKKPQAHGAGQ